MSDNLPEDVRKAYEDQLGSGTPTEQQIRDAIAESAKLGANGESQHYDDAAKAALDYYDKGLSPEDAAVAGAAAGRNKMMADKPSLTELGQAYNDASSKSGNFFKDLVPWSATNRKVDNFVEDNNLGLDSDARGKLSDVADYVQDQVKDPTLAGQAVAAVANAQSGGALSPSGLEILGNLHVTVHSDVTFTLENAHIKTVRGNATYKHTADVNILAPTSGVYLTAGTVNIFAQEKEKNWVTGDKTSRRLLAASYGYPENVTHVKDYQMSATLASYTVYGAQAHVAPFKLGGAWRQATRGVRRDGIKAAGVLNANNIERTIGGLLSLGPCILFIIL